LSSRTSHYHRRETILVCSLYLRHVTIWMNEYQSSRRTPAATDIDDPVNRRQACRSLPEPVTSTYLSCPLGLTPSKPSRLDRAGLGSRCRQGAPSLQRPYSYPQRLDPCLLLQLHSDKSRNPSLVLRPRVSFSLQSSQGSALCTRLPLANEQPKQRGHYSCCCGHCYLRVGAEVEESMARPLIVSQLDQSDILSSN
jgi:hypothetical protein